MARYIGASGQALTTTWIDLFVAGTDGAEVRGVNYWISSTETNGAEVYIVGVHGADPGTADPAGGEYIAPGGSLTRAAIKPNNAGGITRVMARSAAGASAIYGSVEQA